MRAQSVVRREPRSSRLLGLVYIAGLVGLLLPGCSADRFGEPDSPGTAPAPAKAVPSVAADGAAWMGLRDRLWRLQGDDDCQNDTYCACPPDIRSERCACVPWGRHRGRATTTSARAVCSCRRSFATAAEVRVARARHDPPAYKDVLTTPLVIDLKAMARPRSSLRRARWGRRI